MTTFKAFILMPRKKYPKIYAFFLKLFGGIEKRQRFIIATAGLTFLFTGATFFGFEHVWIIAPLMLLTVYFLMFFAILQGITRMEWVTLFLHPMYFSLAFYLFYFFVPQRWLTRLPFVVIYVVSIYAIALSQNIFNVGVSKSLQLFRAAFSVNYLFLTISSFLAYSLIVSLRLHVGLNALLVFVASFPLVMHMLWSVNPDDVVSKKVVSYSLFISLLLGEASMILSLMPVNQSIFALMLTSLFYSLTGSFYTHLQGALYRERVREFVLVFGFALVVLILTLQW